MDYSQYFLERYANDKLAEARDFVARERLGPVDRRGRTLRWEIIGLAVISLVLIPRLL